jgi:hypothetical protein
VSVSRHGGSGRAESGVNGVRRTPSGRPASSRAEREEMDGFLTWAEVSRTHRVRNGVYHRRGRLVSLLTDFGRINPCYPDEAGPDGETISYTGEGRHGDQSLSPGNRALLAAIESGHAVPLFNKLAVGRWQHTGFWRVEEAEHRFDSGERRMLWRFTLRRVRRPARVGPGVVNYA